MRRALALALLGLASPLAAKDSLGVFSDWAAFRDPSVPRCYAIAKPTPSRLSRDNEPFATIGTWPRRQIRGQVHFRLSRMLAKTPSIQLRIGSQRFDLTGGGGDAWAEDRTMDAAIVAAILTKSHIDPAMREHNSPEALPTSSAQGLGEALAQARARLGTR